MFGLADLFVKGVKIAAKSLVVILTDEDGVIWKIFNDGEGGPVIITDDENLFERILDLFN